MPKKTQPYHCFNFIDTRSIFNIIFEVNIKFCAMFALFLLFVMSSQSSMAAKPKLPIPRFATIKFDEVNARTGPANNCPIEWIFTQKGEPVEIIAEYDHWRRIRDIKGEGGWIHVSALSGKRSAVVVAKDITSLQSKPGNYAKVVANLSPNLRCTLKKCATDWCQIQCSSYRGWIARKLLWGVYPEEEL